MTGTQASDLATIVQRLSSVEKEVAELKRHVQEQPSNQPWYLKHIGMFADDAEFQEMVRLGNELRKADQPE